MKYSTFKTQQMFKKLAFLFFSLLSVGKTVQAHADQPAAAANDMWITYDRASSDGRQLVVLARAGNPSARTLLYEGRATVISCQPDPKKVSEGGMPQNTTILYEFEDRLDKEPIFREAGALHIASVTGLGQRRIYIVHPDPLDFTLFMNLFRVADFSCDVSEVEDRQALIQLISPTALELQLGGDLIVIASLRERGDNGVTPRETDFWFYGRRGSLNQLAATLKTHNFTLKRWLSEPNGVVLSRTMPITNEEFQALTPLVVDLAGRFNVEYDGWEANVLLKY